MRAALLLGAFAASGCAATVRLASIPSGATIESLDPDTGDVLTRCLAPCDVRMVRKSGRSTPYRISLPGREPLTVDLMRTEGRVLRWIGGALFQKGGREVTFLLVPERAPITSDPGTTP